MMTCSHCGGMLKAWSHTQPLIQKSTGLEPVPSQTVKLLPHLGGEEGMKAVCPACQRPKVSAND